MTTTMDFKPTTSISIDDPLDKISGIGPGTLTEFEDTYNVYTIKEALLQRIDIIKEVSETWEDEARKDILRLNASAKELDVESRGYVDCLLYKVATAGGFYDSDGNDILNPLEKGAYIDGARNRANTVQVSPTSEINTLSSIFKIQPTLYIELENNNSFRTYLFAEAELRDVDTSELRFKTDGVPYALLSEKYLESVSNLFGIDYTKKENLEHLSLADRPDFPLKFHADDRDSSAVIAPRFSSDADAMEFSNADKSDIEFVDYYEV